MHHPSRIKYHVSRIMHHVAALLCLFYLLPAASAQIPFTLDTTTWPEPKAISLVIPDSGLIALQLVRTNSAVWTNVLEFRLLSFRDVVTGTLLPVKMFLPGRGAPSNAVEQCDFRLQPNQALLELTLVVPPPASTNTYLGSLGIRESNGVWIIHKLALRRPGPQKPATLVVDQPALSVSVKHRSCGTRNVSSPDVAVTLHDETRTWPIEGISISPRSVSSPVRSSLNFDKNVVVFLNGALATNLTQSPSEPKDLAQRSIPAGGQAALGLSFVRLDPGEYTLELKLLALNSKDDDKQQRLTMNLKVSDSFLPAVITLIAALLVSFTAYKWLRIYQQRLGFQRQLAALSPPWLQELPPFYSVVWVRTVLAQTEALIRNLRFVTPDLITERLDKVTPVLDALNEARKARAAMRDFPPCVTNRFDAVVTGLVGSMSDQDMDKAAAQKTRDALRALNADFAAGRRDDSYWAEVEKGVLAFFTGVSEKDLNSFVTRLEVAGITPEAKTIVNTVLSPRKAPPKPPDLRGMMDYEENYMKVKLLYERQDQKEFPDLVKALEDRLERTFALADDADWEQIKSAELRVVPPLNDGLSAHETYEPLPFAVTTGDKKLDESYLFHHGLKFKWNVSLGDPTDQHGPPDKHEPSEGGPETLSPRIVYYSVQPGKLWVSAWITRERSLGSGQNSVQPASLPIANSSEFKSFQHWERAEGLSLVLAGLFAIVSGLLTFYYKNPTFGSFQDYLTLFLWGVGVDQTKNFLQVMQSTKTANP